MSVVNPPNCPDYVVEMGDSGNWYYRKWLSGKIELWLKETFTVQIRTTSGQMYKSADRTMPALPTNLGTITPTMIMLDGYGDNTAIIGFFRSGTNGTTYAPIRPATSNSVNVVAYWHVVGTYS